jgi:hypothetical protein
MKRKEVEIALKAAILRLATSDGYVESKEQYVICEKSVDDNAIWFLHGSLANNRPPYSIFYNIGCEYKNASKVMCDFIVEKNIFTDRKGVVLFISELERHTTDKSVLHVHEKNIEEIAELVFKRMKEGTQNFLAPRINQAVVVNECLTKPPHKWLGLDLFSCCVMIVSYGLINGKIDLIQQGINRVFDILQTPNFSQRHLEFFEALRKAIDQQYGPNQ